MASIPDLRTLRTDRRGVRSRGGRPDVERSIGDGNSGSSAYRDSVVQQTDNDASHSRMSAVALGYLQDPYASFLSLTTDQVPRRYPLINRGTYVRTTAIDNLLDLFVQTRPREAKQIVSLGAGSDTRFFRLCARAKEGSSPIKYHEIDFEVNISQKRAAINRSVALSDVLHQAERHGSQLFLHAVDLRDLFRKSPPSISNLDPALPTLILSECCLCYLPPDEAESVIQYFQTQIESSTALVMYEPIRPFDAFGKTMVTNLASRGIHLQTLKKYSTLEAQRERFRDAGFIAGQGARDVYQIWSSKDWVSSDERDRIDKLEWLDELEEWVLLARHYCIAWAWKGQVFEDAFCRLNGGRTSDEATDSTALRSTNAELR